MPCTTILVGKKASYDGSTIIARNDDPGSGHYTSKKFAVIHPEDQPRKYKSVLSHVEIELPENPMRYTAMPNAEEGEGIWAACGVNEAHVGMTATETITSNPRVLGADPLVRYQPAKTAVAGEMGDKCVERSRALAKEFKDVADRLGCHFIDAGSIPGIEMYPYDWMHLSLDSHRIFAEYLAEYLPKIV